MTELTTEQKISLAKQEMEDLKLKLKNLQEELAEERKTYKIKKELYKFLEKEFSFKEKDEYKIYDELYMTDISSSPIFGRLKYAGLVNSNPLEAPGPDYFYSSFMVFEDLQNPGYFVGVHQRMDSWFSSEYSDSFMDPNNWFEVEVCSVVSWRKK